LKRMQFPRCILALLVALALPAWTSKVEPSAKKKAAHDKQALDLKEAVGAAYSLLDEVIISHREEKPVAHVSVDSEEKTKTKNKGVKNLGATQVPVRAQMSKKDLENFLDRLSDSCRTQFEKMLEGEGAAKDLHRFGTSEKHMNEDGCTKIGGAICKNHAQVTESYSAADGRLLTSRSAVDGDSCLPKSCIKEPDLKLLAGFVQHHAVQSLGAATTGQKAPEVSLDVDCTMSGGSTYSGSGSWDMEKGGAGKIDNGKPEKSMASGWWAQTSCLVALPVILAAWL